MTDQPEGPETPEAPGVPGPAEAAGEVLYSAELVLTEDGTYALTVRDHRGGADHTTTVSPKAVRLLPVYLSRLGLRRK